MKSVIAQISNFVIKVRRKIGIYTISDMVSAYNIGKKEGYDNGYADGVKVFITGMDTQLNKLVTPDEDKKTIS